MQGLSLTGRYTPGFSTGRPSSRPTAPVRPAAPVPSTAPVRPTAPVHPTAPVCPAARDQSRDQADGQLHAAQSPAKHPKPA